LICLASMCVRMALKKLCIVERIRGMRGGARAFVPLCEHMSIRIGGTRYAFAYHAQRSCSVKPPLVAGRQEAVCGEHETCGRWAPKS
jgi:hypothetical protein